MSNVIKIGQTVSLSDLGLYYTVLQTRSSFPQRVIIQHLDNPQHEMPVSQPAQECSPQGGQSFGDLRHGNSGCEIHRAVINLEDVAANLFHFGVCI